MFGEPLVGPLILATISVGVEGVAVGVGVGVANPGLGVGVGVASAKRNVALSDPSPLAPKISVPVHVAS